MDGQFLLIVVCVLIVGVIAAIYYTRRHFLRKQRGKLLKELRSNYQKAIDSGNAVSIRAAGRIYYTAVGKGSISETSLSKIEFVIDQVDAK